GKKMKCPKCAAVFVAAEDAPKKAIPTPPPEPELEDEFEEHAPKKKGKAVSDEDMDDLLSFAEKDASDDNNPFQDEEEVKPKAKAKKIDDEAFEDEGVPVMKKADDEEE